MILMMSHNVSVALVLTLEKNFASNYCGKQICTNVTCGVSVVISISPVY